MDSVVHFEIPADDVDRAKKFYKEVFGWKTTDFPELKYTIVQTGPSDEKGMPSKPGCIGGGMMQRRQIAIMYDKHAGELDSECDKFKVAGKAVTPELIESVKKELCGK